MRAAGSTTTVVVVTGGDPIAADELGLVPDDAIVIAADAGIEQALAHGLDIDLAVGDFDSVSEDAVQKAVAGGAEVERHSPAKDATDLELALDAAMRHRPQHLVVIGGHGGRVDHFLATAQLLASPAYAAARIVAQVGPARVTVIRDQAQLTGGRGDLVTLMAMHGLARGVTTEGLLYPLDGEDLAPGSTRGVSNELAHAEAAVSLTDGVLLAVQPGQRGTHLDAGLAG